MPPQGRTARMHRQVYIANQSFVANVNGIDKAFHEGRTRAYEGDEISSGARTTSICSRTRTPTSPTHDQILWHSVAPFCPTGYGTQTALFAPKIAALDDIDLAI
jgi:hypothetical protein